jgi:hypothetical protein
MRLGVSVPHFQRGCAAIGCGFLVLIPIGTLILAKYSPRTLVSIIGHQPTSAELIKELGGDDVAAVLRNATRVEAVLIEPPEGKHDNNPANYRAVSERQLVDSNVASSIGHTLLLPEEHRDLGVRKACLPRYGVKLTYLAANDRVDVYFCFECALLAVHLNGKSVGGLDFEFAFRHLIHDVRQIFPDHKGLGDLAKNWRR